MGGIQIPRVLFSFFQRSFVSPRAACACRSLRNVPRLPELPGVISGLDGRSIGEQSSPVWRAPNRRDDGNADDADSAVALATDDE